MPSKERVSLPAVTSPTAGPHGSPWFAAMHSAVAFGVMALLVACSSNIGASDNVDRMNGGSEDESFEQFCQQNPQDETCVFCQQNPQECQGEEGGTDTGEGSFEEYCQQNPQDEDCVFCQQNPQDAFCQNPDGGGTDTGTDPGGEAGSFEEYCQQNPQDEDCVYCQQNPQDQFCQNPDGGGSDTGGDAGSFEEYCQQNPQDEDCVYCQQNPQDSYCQE